MQKLIWDKEKYSVGNRLIDFHHQTIFLHINRLIHLSNQAAPKRSTYFKQLHQLNDHICHHFIFEESQMRLAGYPEADTHCKLHRSSENFLKQFLLDPVQINMQQATASISEWFLNELIKEDMHMKPYFQQAALNSNSYRESLT